jgi:hypothetical protein
VARPEPVCKREQLVPGFERPLLRVSPLRVLNAKLGRVDVEQPPADGPRQHLPERLGRFEAMPGRDRHPPRGDRWRPKLTEPVFAERVQRLRQQPAKLLDRLRLALMLGEIDVDELGERRRLHQPLLAPQPLKRPLERLSRRLLRRESAALQPPRAATADPIPIRPKHPIAALCCERKHLPLLCHHRHLPRLSEAIVSPRRHGECRLPAGAGDARVRALHRRARRHDRRGHVSRYPLPSSGRAGGRNLQGRRPLARQELLPAAEVS